MTPDADRNSTAFGFALSLAALSLLAKYGLFLALCLTGGPRIMAPDSASYDDSARSLVRTGRFAVSPAIPDRPQLVRTPGYPAFIALVYLACGERRSAVIVVQIAVSILTVLLAYRTAREGWGPRAAAAAALVLALDPVSFVYSGVLLTETLFTFLLCLAACAGARFAFSGSGGGAFLLGLGISLATLVRPIGYYLLAPVLLWAAIIEARRGAPLRRIAFRCGAAALPWVLLVGGWQMRNLRAAGSAEFSHITGLSLLHYRAADVVAMRDAVSLDEARARLMARVPAADGLSPGEASARLSALAISVLREHPWLVVKSSARGAAKMLCVPGEYELLGYCGADVTKDGCLGDLARLSPRAYAEKWLAGRKSQFAAFLPSAAYLLLVGLCALCSLAKFRGMEREARWAYCLLVIIAAYLVVFSAGPEAGPRFRVPLMPFLSVLAAIGLVGGRGRSCGGREVGRRLFQYPPRPEEEAVRRFARQ